MKKRFDRPVILVQTDTDPGDMGEPREVWDDVEQAEVVFVPSFDLWRTGGLDVLDAEIARRQATDYQRLPAPSDAHPPSIREGEAAARAMQHGELIGLKLARHLIGDAGTADVALPASSISRHGWRRPMPETAAPEPEVEPEDYCHASCEHCIPGIAAAIRQHFGDHHRGGIDEKCIDEIIGRATPSRPDVEGLVSAAWALYWNVTDEKGLFAPHRSVLAQLRKALDEYAALTPEKETPHA